MNDDNTFGGDVFGEDHAVNEVPPSAAAATTPEEDNDNLYDDLKLQAALPSKKSGDSEATAELKAQMERLQQENATLKRNISILYRTAQHELNRKQKRIAALEEQLQNKGKKT